MRIRTRRALTLVLLFPCLPPLPRARSCAFVCFCVRVRDHTAWQTVVLTSLFTDEAEVLSDTIAILHQGQLAVRVVCVLCACVCLVCVLSVRACVCVFTRCRWL